MPNISVFKNVLEPSTPIDCDLLTHLEDIRDGMWRDIVLECRSIKDKEKRSLFKQKMPTATLSGQFSYRNEQGLIEHSGILAIDLDHVENIPQVRKRLMEDRYVYSLWISPSGDGFRVLFFIDPYKHRESFRGIAQYLSSTYGLIADRNGSNVSKPYIVSYDPLLYLNPDKVPEWKRYLRETVIKPIQNFVHTEGDFQYILKEVVARNVDITNNDYNDWVRLGICIADKFGEDGRDYFRQLSQSKQTKISVDEQYKRCLKANKDGERVGIATFYYLAKTAGINIVSEQTKTIIRATRNGKKTGLKKEQIISNLKEFENIVDADVIVGNVYDSPTGYSEEEESILHILELFISNNYSLRMNEVTGYIESKGKPQTESDLNTIFIAAKKVAPKLDFKLMMRLLKSDFIPTFNPFIEFLGSDGIPYMLPATPIENGTRFSSPLIDKLSATIKNDNPAYTQYFTRKWIVSIISAMHKLHSPLVHTLLGPIGTGKTEWYRRLLPPELHPYYQQSKLDKGKDDELLMCENILILDDELSGKSKADSIKLNNITSTDFFSLRRPYGDHNEKVLRYAVLCGTSNYPKGVIPDTSLNRRIIPIDCFNVNKEDYNLIDKKELFIEAFRLYKEGFDWRITSDDVAYLNQDAEQYESTIKEKDLVDRFYFPGNDYKMTATDIAIEIEFMTRQKLNVNSIGRELSKLGFKNKSVRESKDKVTSRWMVNKRFPEQSYNQYQNEEKPF